MRRLYYIFALTCFTSFAQQRTVKADSLIAYAKTFLGTKYCYGQCTPKKGFDCSGFVQYVFAHFDIEVPRCTMDYERAGKKIKIDSCRTGDIIVFTGTNAKNRAPGHVGIILTNGAEGITFIHSSSGKKHNGVTITNYTHSKSYKIRFIKIVRLSAVLP